MGSPPSDQAASPAVEQISDGATKMGDDSFMDVDTSTENVAVDREDDGNATDLPKPVTDLPETEESNTEAEKRKQSLGSEEGPEHKKIKLTGESNGMEEKVSEPNEIDAASSVDATETKADEPMPSESDELKTDSGVKPEEVEPEKPESGNGQAELSTEEPKAEDSKAEEPKAEDSKTEEPKAEETKAEEPKTEEPKAEEPKAEEPKAEESKPEENKGSTTTEPGDNATPLERAQAAAKRAEIHTLPELDPIELPAAGTGLPRHQHKYALSAIRAIKRLKDAAPFVAPVDPVKQGVPHYFEYIKHPMDLGTIEKKLVDNKYDTVQQIVDDFNLVVSNCIIFNGEEAMISKMALSIAQSFRKQLSNMPTYDATRKGSQAAAAAAAAAASHSATNGSAASPLSTSVADSASSNDTALVMEDGTPEAVYRAHAASGSVGGTSSTSVLGPNGVPTIRRKPTLDGRPKREVRPPRHASSGYVGSGTGEGRPRNKKFAAELRFAGQVLREMQSRKLEAISWPFLAPVDPIEQGVPTYFDVIKEPMDLSTISRKLSEGIYYNADEFESDVRLMFRNCYTFNPQGTPVNVLGHKLEDHFDQRWVEKPIPGLHNNEDSDMSDVDEEYAESGMANPAIDVLEEQLRMIRKQLKRLKKDALADFHRRGQRKSGGANSNAKRRRGSQSGPVSGSSRQAMPTEITYEVKREIRDKIYNLPEKKINTVLAIIQESMPELANGDQDEIEIEVDQLDQQTLLRLYSYAVLGRREPKGTTHPTTNGGSHAGSPGLGGADLDANTSKRRSKALSDEEHSRQIAEIQSKLKEFDAAGSPGASTASSTLGNSDAAGSASAAIGGAAAGSAGLDSDSSDDEAPQFESDSSSEEE